MILYTYIACLLHHITCFEVPPDVMMFFHGVDEILAWSPAASHEFFGGCQQFGSQFGGHLSQGITESLVAEVR